MLQSKDEVLKMPSRSKILLFFCTAGFFPELHPFILKLLRKKQKQNNNKNPTTTHTHKKKNAQMKHSLVCSSKIFCSTPNYWTKKCKIIIVCPALNRNASYIANGSLPRRVFLLDFICLCVFGHWRLSIQGIKGNLRLAVLFTKVSNIYIYLFIFSPGVNLEPPGDDTML